MDNGYVALHRKFKDWEWYKNIPVKTLFQHCLIMANFKDKKWQGIEIKRGSFLTSVKTLSIETGLSDSQVRTALDKLKLTNELTIKTTNRYSVVTVLKYNDYQSNDKQTNKQLKNKSQTDNNQIATTNNNKKEKKVNNKYYDGVELNVLFLELLAIRKKLGAINTERAINGLLNKLEPFEDNVKSVMILESIISSWKSVFPLKKDKLDHYKKILPADIKSDWLDDYIQSL